MFGAAEPRVGQFLVNEHLFCMNIFGLLTVLWWCVQKKSGAHSWIASSLSVVSGGLFPTPPPRIVGGEGDIVVGGGMAR